MADPACPQGQSSPSSFAEADGAPGSAVRALSEVTVGIAQQRKRITAGRTWAQGKQCWHPPSLAEKLVGAAARKGERVQVWDEVPVKVLW